MSDLVERLRRFHAEIVDSDGGESPQMAMTREAADRIAALEAEVAMLQDRLEMRHAWQIEDGKKVRVEVEPGSIPDGIECRDETIRQQDRSLRELAAENARLREALQKLASPAAMAPLRDADKEVTARIKAARAALEAGNG